MAVGFDAAVPFDSPLVLFDGAGVPQLGVDDLRVELFLKSDPLWSNITSGVRVEDGVRISRGRTTEDGESAPSSCSMTLDNLNGRYSPRYTAGAFYGRIGRNTPLRVGFGKPAQGATQTGTGATVTYPQVAGSNGYGATTGLAVAVCTPVDTLSTPAGYTGAAETDAAAFTVKRSRLVSDADVLPSTTSTASGTPTAWTTAHIAIPGATFVAGGTATGDAGLGPGGIGVSGLTVGDLIVVVVAWSADVLGRMQPPFMYGGLDPAEMYMICDSGPHATAPRVAAYAYEQRSTHFVVDFFGALDGVTGSSMTVSQYTGQARYAPRFCGEVADWPIAWTKDENNKTVALEAGGVSRRLTQSQDAPSVIRAAFGNLPELTNYWPMEDAPGAVDFAPAIGTSRMTPVNGISAGAVDTWGGSYATPDFTGRGAEATVTPSNAAPFGFGCITAIPPLGTAAGNNLIFGSFETAGAADVATVGVEYTNSTTLTAKVQYQGGTTASTSLGSLVGICPDGLLGQQLFIYVALAQNGANIDWAVTLINITPGSDYVQLVASASYAAHTLGALNRISLGVESGTGTTIGTNEVTHGHAFVTPSSTFTNAISRTYAARGYDGATVTGALQDQAADARAPITFVFPDEDNLTCSPGSPGNLMARLHELALTGQGLLQDAAGFPGLEWRPNASIISRAPVYTFDYSAVTFTDPLYPVDDDAVTLNDATVMLPRGGQARVTVETGTLGCQAAGVGRYANEFTAPAADVNGARDLASWLTAQGTTDLARWPLVGLRMSGAGNVDLPMPRFSIGDTVRMSNLPSWSGPATLDLIVVGMLDDVSDALWTVTLITRPAELYRVLIWDDATFGVWADSAAPATTDRRWGL